MKKVLFSLSVGLFVLMLSGCEALLGKVLEETVKSPASPEVALDDTESSYTQNIGDEIILKVKASVTDGGSLSYQWYKDSKAINGKTSSSYTFTIDDNSTGAYYCKVTNTNFGKTSESTSNRIYVNIRDAGYPYITMPEKKELSLHYGEEANLSISATVDEGYGTLSYQWYKGTNYTTIDTPIEGATEATYTVVDDKESEFYYACKVTCTNNGKTKEATSEDFFVKISNIIEVESIYESTVWDSRFTYLLKGGTLIRNKLTIPAGTVVKFDKDAWMTVEENGFVIADGDAESETTPANPIIFTAATDNSVGIVIPGCEDLEPYAGYWDSIILRTQGSIFDNCIIRYAGSSYSYGAFVLDDKNTVTNCIISDNESSDFGVGALKINESAIDSVVTGNILYNNNWPLSCVQTFTVDPSNIFHFDVKDENGTVTETLKNTHQVIYVYRFNRIDQGQNPTWGITEVPYYSADDIVIYGKLTILDNVIVRFASGTGIDVYADDGGQFIIGNCILTSYRDDANGGDIFADGEDTALVGDWDGVWIDDNFGWQNDINLDETKVLYNDPDYYTVVDYS